MAEQNKRNTPFREEIKPVERIPNALCSTERKFSLILP
jgi:hypothetical protein